jgi:hypothetical protein
LETRYVKFLLQNDPTTGLTYDATLSVVPLRNAFVNGWYCIIGIRSFDLQISADITIRQIFVPLIIDGSISKCSVNVRGTQKSRFA